MDRAKEWNLHQLELEKGKKGKEEDLKWFRREKNRTLTEKEKFRKKKIERNELSKAYQNLYFDTETFEYYKSKDDPEEQPMIIPYLIGSAFVSTCMMSGILFAQSTKRMKYRQFIGVDAAKQFLDYALNQAIWLEKDVTRSLCAYNIDYDFHVLRPWITTFFPNIGIEYRLSDEKKFLFGDLRWNKFTIDGEKKKRVPKIRLVDLWRWDMSKSLASYMKYIVDLTYDVNGEVRKLEHKGQMVDDPTSFALHTAISALGFDRNSFKKLSIDYKKVNLHQVGDDFYYWRSKEDWIADKEPVKLDLEAELKYLEMDVKSLHVVKLEQEMFKEMALAVLQIWKPIDRSRAISVPGFAKYLCEEFEKKYMTETYRYPTTPTDYEHQEDSYFGAFVGGNKDITYLDKEVFEQLYPGKDFYDKDGTPRIKSYDVNSMYPWAMSLGLPVGTILYTKPSKPHVVWYEVQFKSYIYVDPEDKKKGIAGRVYKWKDKYNCLNNCFFANSFEVGLIPNVNAHNKVYVLKEIWELFDSMCDHTGVIINERYQLKSMALKPFVETLYEIKADREKKEPKTKRELIKLILNSLYGKMAERFKQNNIRWIANAGDFICTNPHYQEYLDKHNIAVPEDLKVLKKLPSRFKHKIAPFVDFKEDHGFCITPNVSHRYDQNGMERRESITAGMFITSKSRWKLLSAVKGEIDQGNVILYCDTDSIKLIQFKKPKFKCDNYELGAWKNEGSFTHFGHPNRLKKYFMHNADIEYTKETEKLCWQVKTSGVSEKYIRAVDGKFDLEMIKIIYNPHNRVLLKRCKRCSVKNDWYQNVIKDVDFKFIFDDPDAEITHVVEDNKLTCI